MQQARSETAPTAQQGCNTRATQALPERNDGAPRVVVAASLTPKLPPGRSSRKGLAFGTEIVRLRSQGYTLEAIRQALLEVGVSVCRSTILREAARHARAPEPPVIVAPPSRRDDSNASPSVPMPAGPPVVAARPPPSSAHRSGRDIAETFIRGRITNPLVRDRLRNKELKP